MKATVRNRANSILIIGKSTKSVNGGLGLGQNLWSVTVPTSAQGLERSMRTRTRLPRFAVPSKWTRTELNALLCEDALALAEPL
jgi:hypothetical protein